MMTTGTVDMTMAKENQNQKLRTLASAAPPMVDSFLR